MALTDNLIGYWKFDEASGNAASEVNSYTLTNVSTTPFSTGKINNAADPDGASDYFERTNSEADFAFGAGTFSISFWINTADGTGPVCANGNYNANGDTHWDTGMGNIGADPDGNAGKLSFSGASGYHVSASTYNDSAWHHVVWVREGTGASQFKLYVDDTNTDTFTNASNISATTLSFRVGFYNHGTPAAHRMFDGLIDELGIWKGKALTSTEVSELYNSGAGLQYPFTTDVTVTPAALTLSTTSQTPTITVLIIPSTLTMTSSVKSAFAHGISLSGTIEVGTGKKGTRFVSNRYPVTSGLTAGTEKTEGRQINLVPTEGSFVSRRLKSGF